MDKSSVGVEGSQTKSDPVATASKSVGTIVRIDSISIDITCAMEEIEPKEHDHFTIREFVAGMRGKNPKKCTPFDTKDIAAERMTAPDGNQPTGTNDAGTSSRWNAKKERDGSLSRDIQREGDPCDKPIVCSQQCTEEHTSACGRERTDSQNDEDGKAIARVTEAEPLLVVERDPNTSIIAAKPDKASSCSENGVDASHRRRQKLRSLIDIMDEKKISTDVEADLEPRFCLDVLVDVPRATKSPQRKKKNVLEEDRGRLEVGNSTCGSKRSKGPAEKTSTRVDSGSEGGASALLNLRYNATTLQIKPKKNKSLDINRKTRQRQTTREVSQVKDVRSPILHEHSSATETCFGNLGRVPSPSFLSGLQIDTIPNLPKGKTPVFESRYHGEVALDLSLNSCANVEKNSDNQVSSGHHRGIPDLNESFMEKIPMIQGNQLPTFSEKSSLPLLSNLEMTPSCSKNVAGDQPQAAQNMDSNAEPRGVSDDIPMDIVKLLDKNQRERALGNSKQQLAPEGRSNSVRGSSADCTARNPGTLNFPFTHATRGKTAVSQGISNFLQPKNFYSGVGNPEESQFRLFGSSMPSLQYPASNLGSRPNEQADLFWPPRQQSVRFRVSHVTPIHPNALNLHSLDNGYNKGKNVNSVKGSEKKTLWNASVVNEGRIGTSSKPAGSVDAYSNDTIPAMQLLSLMDRGIASSSSYNTAPNSFLEKHISPYDLKGTENQNDLFPDTSFFSQNTGIARLINGLPFVGQTPAEHGSSKTVPLEGMPSNIDPELGICTLNKNPADFTTPDEGNEFTLSYKELKLRKRTASKERTNADGQRRQRARRNSRK